MRKYPCPCCGYLVFKEPAGRTSAHCPICLWADDWVDSRYARVPMGPNHVSLADAQKNYAQFGSSSLNRQASARLPLETEIRDSEWRPIDDNDVFEIVGLFGSPPPPLDMTQLYYWRKNYWRAEQLRAPVSHEPLPKYPCPCCGYLVIEKRRQTCPICQWSEDWVSLLYPNRSYSFNEVCLIIAQRNYAEFGASTPERQASARPPRNDEQRDPRWRMIVKEDKFESPGERHTSPRKLPKDTTKLFYWNDDYWLADWCNDKND